ncbi:SDR family NAD(P)-dependent oxidoreductase [Vibrio sp. CAIM 722]|uniref:SDR family NAD(P)-dependent oxidoreductase n=1 Tax=Vibrio eleionomae TaxID=2653505 RepID=A0A7X4RWN1_9VIBR|nr:SDR family NAD(P)-dependent oxidoreductase [Vibrio eleionomae]MZI95379.1 SDR family NAD(P)-dependent oxidoreductase [Vibrio eleionomae]
MSAVLITGAARGFGRVLAQQFASQSFDLFLVVRSVESAAELQAELPQSHILIADITTDKYVEQLSGWLDDQVLDVVINNAGTGTKAPNLELTKASYLRKEFNSHCVGALNTVQGALSALKRSQTPTIVNISSRRGSMQMQAEGAAKGSGCSFSYRIGKASQNMLSLCLADELEDENFKVVSLHPGRLLTGMSATDAQMTPELAASRLINKIQHGQLPHRHFYNLETETELPW